MLKIRSSRLSIVLVLCLAAWFAPQALAACPDSDGDGICNSHDACPLDPQNDADGDGICGNVDPCPLDPANDADGDGICGNVDACPLDPQNDADGDGICGNVDACPLDPANDADGDGICGNVDACPLDPGNDSDGDGICGNLDPCPTDPSNDVDGDGICGAVDACPNDPQNDIDGDGICGNLDPCPLDPANDADGDGLCSDADACPLDPGNDLDDDGVCDDVDACPQDPANDVDEDGICGDVDICPLDPANDIDQDARCADVDNCPTVFNPSQADIEGDGEGDACDTWLNCGLPDDGAVHLPNPAYTDASLLPKPQGGSYLDLAFNPAGPQRAACAIVRLTDAGATGIVPARYHHEYASMSPFNSDSSLILLHDAGYLYTGSHDGVFVVDLHGNVVRTAAEVQIDSAGEPRWSVTDPQLIYYHTRSQSPNQVLSYHVSSGTRTVIFQGTGSVNLDFAGGSGDVSPDGNYMVLHVGGILSKEFHRLNLATGIPGPALTSDNSVNDSIGDACMVYNFCDMTPVTNNIVCRFDYNLYDPNCLHAPTRYELFDGQSGAFIQEIVGAGGHSDIGRDITGAEIMVMTNDFNGGLTDCYPGIFKINIWTLEKKCLLDYGHSVPPAGGSGPFTGWWNKGSHVSINNVGGHPWALISNYDYKPSNPDTRDFNPDLPADWQEIWGKYFNEILLVKLDGSQVFRLAHHRSREDGYFATPRAALSRDGKYVVFDSNYALQTGVAMYSDVYLLRTTFLPPPPGGGGGGGGKQNE